jgi:Bacterial Ig domain
LLHKTVYHHRKAQKSFTANLILLYNVINHPMKFLAKILYVICLLNTLGSCDKVHDDTLPSTLPTSTVVESQTLSKNTYYTETSQPLVLDLLALDNLAGSQTIRIVSQPTKGSLFFVNKTLLRYQPDSTEANIDDSFTVTGTKANGSVQRDTVYLKVHNDLSQAPCNAGAIPDVAKVVQNKSILINVLKNDRFCNVSIDSSSLKIDFLPQNGVATITKNQIIYTPNTGFKGNDQFVYRICTIGDKPICRMALVRVTIVEEQQKCKTVLIPDHLVWERTTNQLVSPAFDVTRNDILCDGYFKNGLVITNNGKYGKATITTDRQAISYTLSNTNATSDSFEYALCDPNGANCVSASVKITINTKTPNSNCNNEAKADEAQISLQLLPASKRIEIPVLANDKLCQTIQGIAINKAAKYGTAIIEDGKVYYVANANYTGQDVFTYEIIDTNGNKSTAKVNVSIVY